jgi:phosphoenolpyruvate carboxykinase (GTP)
MSYVVKHAGLNKWVRQVADMCQPESIYWCDGSKEEYDRLMGGMVASGAATPIPTRPNSFLFRSDPSDVARVEDRTYISTTCQEDAGRTQGHSDGALYGLHERAHDVRDPLLDGTPGLAHGQDRH